MSDAIYGGPNPKSIDPDWSDHAYDGVVCLVNGEVKKKMDHRYLARIGWTKEQYSTNFPGAPLICEETRSKIAAKTPRRIAARKHTMTTLNNDEHFQIRRIEGCLAFLASDQSIDVRRMLSEKAKQQHEDGLQAIIREKYWNDMTSEQREQRQRCNVLPFDEFVIRARAVHGNTFHYSDEEYAGRGQKVKIICPIHGAFHQLGANHLRGATCTRCSHFSSKLENEWLDNLGIAIRQKYIPLKPIRKRGAIVDGFDENSNTVYQFHGDFWHGNPAFYDPDDWNVRTKSTFGTLFQNTLELDAAIRAAGYSLVVMWESEWLPKRWPDSRRI